MRHLLLPRIVAVLAGTFGALVAGADSDEAWVRRAAIPAGLRPLLAVVLDRSAATLQTLPAREDYDPVRDYGAGLPVASRCKPTQAYFRRGPGPAPDCTRQAGIDLQCQAAEAAVSRSGFYVASRAAQWHASPDGGYWGELRDADAGAVECRVDRGRHGASPGAWFASNGTGTPWTATEGREIEWDAPPFADAYILYAGNFLNYLQSAFAPVERSIADLAASRLAQALESTDELDVALVRVDDDGTDGGYVARAPASNHVAAADVLALAAMPPVGGAALSETVVEAARWLQGSAAWFGTDVRTDAAALAGGTYRSPFEHACRPVSLALVSAGIASGDEQAAGAAAALAHFSTEAGGCGPDCLATLAAWLGATDLRDDLPGRQSVPVTSILPGHTSPADPLAYVNLVAAAFQHDATVAGHPQLSAAGLTVMDAGGTAPGIILGLTVPAIRARWPGNLFRYGLRAPSSPLSSPTVVDRDGEPAIDAASGLPLPESRSLWSDVPDANLLAGGADGRLPIPDAREVYSDVASARILDAANRLAPGSTRIDRAMLGLSGADPVKPDDVLAWPATQRTLGDPGQHAPLVVDYPDTGGAIAFLATQDGLLHAIDADSGVELWAWMPKEFLPHIAELGLDGETTNRSHGLDGALVLHRYDPDGDGRIEPAAGEHLWLFLGSGRGGNRYYALDIASPLDPRLAWSFALPATDLEARAEPVVARLAIAGTGQSAGNWVVLLAGGHDPRFDVRGATGTGRGAMLHVVDAASGRELWSSGGAESALSLSGLASLPSAPRVLDLDGDGFLDRAYLLDVTGSLWRIDLTSGRPAGELASGMRLARLGSGMQRFFSTPDASLERRASGQRIAITAGSGWLTRPRDESIEDRIYTVFDDIAGGAAREVTEADLFDATGAAESLPADAAGWFLRLAARAGEKVVGSTVTFDHALRFQTYQPLPPLDSDPCGPPRSIARRYAIDVRTALPRNFAAESEDDDPEEREAEGLPVDLRFGFPARWDDACDGCRARPFGIAGGETFDPGYSGDPVRTSWRKLVPPPASR